MASKVHHFFIYQVTNSDERLTLFLYTGLRYKLPFGGANAPKFGFEYNYGSRFLISLQQANDRLLSKLENKGSSYETYIIFPINNFLFARIGHLYVDQDYELEFVGNLSTNPVTGELRGSTAERQDVNIHNFYMLLNASF